MTKRYLPLAWLLALVPTTVLAQTECNPWNPVDAFPESYSIHGLTSVGDQFLIQMSHGQESFNVLTPDGETWTVLESTQPGRIAGNGEAYVAIWGDRIFYSTDLVDWDMRIPGVDGFHSYTSVAWANDHFVAVGNNGGYQISPDGYNWLFNPPRPEGIDFTGAGGSSDHMLAVGQFGYFSYYRSNPADPEQESWRSKHVVDFSYHCYAPTSNNIVDISLVNSPIGSQIVTVDENHAMHLFAPSDGASFGDSVWTGSQFLVTASGGSSALYASNDGLAWAPLPVLDGDLWDIAAGGGRLLARGPENRLVISHDNGTTWVDITSTPFQALTDVTVGPHGMVAVGADGRILNSPGGLNWGSALRLRADQEFMAVAASDDVYVAAGRQSDGIWISTDTDTWERRFAPAAGDLLSLTHGELGFLATSTAGEVLLSSDGNHWDLVAASDHIYLAGVYDGSQFVLVGEDGAVAVTQDAINYERTQIAPGTRLNGVAVNEWGVRVTVGDGGVIYRFEKGEWQEQDSGVGDHLLDVNWNGRQFTVLGDGILTSPDGITWEITAGAPNNTLGLADNGFNTVAVDMAGQIFGEQCGGCNPPVIESHFIGRMVDPGDSVTLNVTVSGDGPFSYQWLKDDQVIPGADQSSYSIETVDAVIHSGVYRCEVSGLCGDLVTPKGFLNVTGEHLILSQSGDMAGCEGDLITLEVVSAGHRPAMDPAFRWRKDGVAVSGAWYRTLDLRIAPDTTGVYTCELLNFGVQAVSEPMAVSIIEPPSFVQQPLDAAACVGESAVFQVQMANAATRLQWYRDDAVLVGQDSPTLTLVAVTEEDAGDYECRAYQTCGSAVSERVKLIIGERTMSISPEHATQGLLPIVIETAPDCSMTQPQFQWINLTTGEVLAETSPRLEVVDPNPGASTYQVTITDLNSSATDIGATTILVPADPQYVDVNGDDCNTLADLQELGSHWPNPTLQGPDMQGGLTILDLMYINISGDCITPSTNGDD